MYIREAHPIDGLSPLPASRSVNDPKTFLEPTEEPSSCAKKLKFSMPKLIEDMKDSTAKNYGGYPDRLYLVGKDGKVVYQGGPGPRGFKPDELEEELKQVLGASPSGKK